MSRGFQNFEQLREGLSHPGAYPHAVDRIEHIETHISLVMLAGDFAYKIKKPLSLGFLDFSTLARRKHYCEEEIRLNRRLAAPIYLAVVPITGAVLEPRIGGDGPAIDYAVKMRRFPQGALLSRQRVTSDLVEDIADQVAAFHGGIPAATLESGFGTPDKVARPMRENFKHIRPRLAPGERARIDALADWTEKCLGELAPRLEARLAEGHVRECHGDMHRGNIALVDGAVTIFDAIEFNAELRWIDTISEVAFLVMDLDECGEPGLARRLLNRYLQRGGDYGALPVLRLYEVYRAMVRAKVIAIRLGQAGLEAEEAANDRRDLARYISLAERYTQPRRPMLVLMHGLAGSGKSRLSAALLEHLDAIWIRSDIERKRLFGLAPDASSHAVGDIYTRQASAHTYGRLLEIARRALDAGFDAIVDASFLRRPQRSTFLELAAGLGRRCAIVSLGAPPAVLRQRVLARQRAGQDPSEAGVEVLEGQFRRAEPLADDERNHALEIDTTQSVNPRSVCDRLEWLRAAPGG